MRARYVKQHWENASRTICSFYFEPEGRYRYEAGQYAVITVPHNNPDSRGETRTMTLTSSPNEPLLKITMRVYRSRGSSYKQALLALQPGDTVIIFDALGDLILPINNRIPLVFVAGGVGIASFVGMVQWLLHTADRRTVDVYHAVARREDIVLQAPFEKYSELYGMTRRLYLPPGDDIAGPPCNSDTIVQTRRLSAADILPVITSDSIIYVSGTERMVQDFRNQLQAAGVSGQQIIFDYFEGYTGL